MSKSPAPDRIWLQYYDGEGSPDDDFEMLCCREKIFDDDVEYVRKDLFDDLLHDMKNLEQRYLFRKSVWNKIVKGTELENKLEGNR